MIEQRILDKIEPHKRALLIPLRDPQRILQLGAHSPAGRLAARVLIQDA
jgi:hypothetical protein